MPLGEEESIPLPWVESRPSQNIALRGHPQPWLPRVECSALTGMCVQFDRNPHADEHDKTPVNGRLRYVPTLGSPGEM
jgi:hypothetical protein